MRKEIAYVSIGALFVTAQVLTAIRAEIFPFFPEPYNLMFAGLVAYILVYCVANILNETEGREEGVKIIVTGLFANFLFLINLHIESLIPEGKGVFPEHTSETFKWLLNTEPRIVLGSLLAYCTAMWINNRIYNSKPERNLVAKYMLAVAAAQVVDTVVFHFTAYLGIVDLNAIIGSIGATIVFKILISLLSIPIFLMGLRGYIYIGVHLEKVAIRT